MRSGGKRHNMSHLGRDSWLVTVPSQRNPRPITSYCTLARGNIKTTQGLLETGSELMLILRDMNNVVVYHSEWGFIDTK